MQRNRTVPILPIMALCAAGWALTAPATLHAGPIPSGTVFTTYADNTGPVIMLLQKGKDPVEFGRIDPGSDGQWVAPLGFSSDGHLYLGSKGNHGSLWDITSGGDASAAKLIASNLFSVVPHKMGGMAFDAEGNVYLSMGQTEDSSLNDALYPIVRVNLKTGQKSNLNGFFNHAWGLAIRTDANKNEILYVVESNTGRVLAYNLTTDKLGDKVPSPVATGFPPFKDHGGNMLVFDPRGHLFVFWGMDVNDTTSGGIFDITNGGNFSDFSKTPPVALYPNRMDVQGMVFDAKNNLLVGGDNTNFVWFSPFDPATGKFGDFVQYTSSNNGGGDSETVAIAP